MSEIIAAVVCGALAIAALVISVRSFMEKGFLFNNAYIWASRQEREKMDKKPHYRQSAIVFAMIAAMFFCMGAEALLKTGWLWMAAGAICAAALVYAVRSSVK